MTAAPRGAAPAASTPLVIHGHFYQPPRENPWTGRIEREPGAYPFHDWNERILSECYRANAFARIFGDGGRVERVTDNYARIQFDFGPTLISWIEARDPRVYARILEADRESARRHGGHGNAIAQGYNHAILPLMDERDRRTQVRWGLADFRHRFRRPAEALWLPETAADDATLGTLIDEGLRFAILSPMQAERVRPLGATRGKWKSVAGGAIDPRAPYRYFHRDRSGRSIAVFFYDGRLASSVAFDGALATSQELVARLKKARAAGGGLVHYATDGESYGHHARFADLTLAYALEVEAVAQGFSVTNHGEYLDEHPPAREVEILAGPDGKGTSWSCAHGVGRWFRDCGCQDGAQQGWNQAWRGPLRAAFDVVRDAAHGWFADDGGRLLRDPWAARDESLELWLDGRGAQERFFTRHGAGDLDGEARRRTLALLELERYVMLQYTSCGWFFADVAGLEAVQVMKYAGRCLDLMKELGFEPPRVRFLETLAQARSNVPGMGTGADIYRTFVEPLVRGGGPGAA